MVHLPELHAGIVYAGLCYSPEETDELLQAIIWDTLIEFDYLLFVRVHGAIRDIQ